MPPANGSRRRKLVLKFFNNRKTSRFRRWWPHVATLAACCAALALAIVGFTYLDSHIWAVSATMSRANSWMAPAFSPGDKIFADETYYAHHSIADGDLVVFRHNDLILIKRVTAVAGETVEIRDWICVEKRPRSK